MTNKTSLTRNLMTACSILALSAVMYGCVGGGDDAAPATDVPDTSDMDTALGAAQMAAMTAATAAHTAATNAATAASTAATLLEADSQQAMDAADDAAAAMRSAILAGEANRRAQATMDSSVAEAEQANAEGHRNAAQMSLTDAMAEQADAQEVVDARGDAMTAAGLARDAADAARAAANTVAGIAAPGSPHVTDSEAAAVDAETAATNADTAETAANAAMTGAAARMAANTAETEQGNAEDARDDALAEQRLAEGVKGGVDLNAKNQAAADAKQYAADAATHATLAASEASDARADANAADTAAKRANSARTDYANAKAAAVKADAAADKAEAASTASATASGMANDAYMAANADDASRETAEAERDTARTQKQTSAMRHMDAEGYAETAETEAGNAGMYEGVHVIGLLQHANAQDLELGNEDDVDLRLALTRAKAARLAAVSMAVNSAVGMHDAADTNLGDRDQDSSTSDTTDSTSTVTASWLGNDLDDENTADVDESAPKMLSIMVTTSSGSNLDFVTMDDPDTDGDDRTATALDRGLGDFVHGYSISIPDAEAVGNQARHAIVFTDKMQGADQVAEVVPVTARYVEGEAVDTATELSLGTDKTGPTYTGVTWTPDGQEPLTGTLSCSDMGCDITVEADGNVTLIDGYVFTGSRDAEAAVAPADAMEDPDYLAFGVWLIEDGDTAAAGNQPSFAAFANGGEPFEFEPYDILTGTANYLGKAAGVHTEGDSVDWFEGDASLTANFGEAPEMGVDDQNGTISGMIDNIMAGGVATGDEISLRSANIEDTTAFSGNARMGMGVDENKDDVLEYRYNGTWSGNFFGAVAAVLDVDTTDADETMAAAAPEAVAGTFGVSGTMGEGDDAVTSTYVGAFGARNVD